MKSKKIIIISLSILIIIAVCILICISLKNNDIMLYTIKLPESEEEQMQLLKDIYLDAIKYIPIDSNIQLGDEATKNIFTGENFSSENLMKLKEVERKLDVTMSNYIIYANYNNIKGIVTLDIEEWYDYSLGGCTEEIITRYILKNQNGSVVFEKYGNDENIHTTHVPSEE